MLAKSWQRMSAGGAFMGLVGSEAERKALLALAEGLPGVSRVADEMIRAY
jgi:hypothetical protein